MTSFSFAHCQLTCSQPEDIKMTSEINVSDFASAWKKFRAPFGLDNCEAEIETLREQYSEFYFHESPFSKVALRESVYLIVGRRGSGKTAISQYFSFQKDIKNPVCIEVSEPDVYQQVLTALASRTPTSRVIAVPQLIKVWEFVIWSTIFHELRERNLGIEPAYSIPSERSGKVSDVIKSLFEFLEDLFSEDNADTIGDSIDTVMESADLAEGIRVVKKFAQTHPIFIALDTLEKYDVRDSALMTAMAALIQFAAKFNLKNSHDGIHLKVFMSGEVFPYLKEVVLLNPLKHVRDPLYLLWRPKELLCLIGWRFWRFLNYANPNRFGELSEINWHHHKEVLEKIWIPFFGSGLDNNRGMHEKTFAYILRHTQMRPRQLIYICNEIAYEAAKQPSFPSFPAACVRLGLKSAETELANEIINSFELTYPNVGKIVSALMGMPMLFMGSELDKRARDTKSSWPEGTYSLTGFRQLVTELGIIGRVSKRNDKAGYVDADFEYSTTDRLTITPRDECVIHPMFYSKLNVQLDFRVRVMPFSVERGEIAELQGLW